MSVESPIPRIDIPRSSVPQEAAEGRTIAQEQGGPYQDLTVVIIDHLAKQADVEGLKGMILWNSDRDIVLSYVLDGEGESIGAERFKSVAKSNAILSREFQERFGQNLNYRIARCGDDFDGFVENATRQPVETMFGVYTPVSILKFTE